VIVVTAIALTKCRKGIVSAPTLSHGSLLAFATPNRHSRFAFRYAKQLVDSSRRVPQPSPHKAQITWALSISEPADLTAPGFTVLLPRTEHAPFELVAYASGKFYLVRYGSPYAGSIYLGFRSVWNVRKGTHDRAIAKTEVDRVAAYRPNTNRCRYVDPSVFRSRCKAALRRARKSAEEEH